MRYDVKCPYCGEGQEICHDDGYGYAEDETYNQECGDCGKNFAYTTSISFHYEVAKADCLNGADHKWKKQTCNPDFFARDVCQDCGESRFHYDEEYRKTAYAEWTYNDPLKK